MSDETPTPAENAAADSLAGEAAPAAERATGETPEAEVVPAAAEPVPVSADPSAVAVESAEVERTEPQPAEPQAAESAAPQPAESAPAPHRVVYVEAPTPPRIRGNRVIGTLLALVGAVVFAGAYALVGALLYLVAGRELFGAEFGAFVASAAFWVPILVFALAFILEVVIVNRGGWAAHVFGSLLLAFVVYFASIGLLLLIGDVLSQQHVTFTRVALTPQIIAAAVIAREVAIWLGLAISARGRSVRNRNAEARATYERELAEQRAKYARPTPEA